MGIERMLGSFRKSVPVKAPMAESLIAAGFMQQWKTEHTGRGGHDPRGVSRQSLQECGVPTSANLSRMARARGTKRPGSARGGMLYMLDAVRKRKREGQTMSREEHYRERAALLREFRCLSMEAQLPFIQQAAAANCAKRLKLSDPGVRTSESKSVKCPMRFSACARSR